MNCDEVERHLATDERRGAEPGLRAHLAACAACRDLLTGAALLGRNAAKGTRSPGADCPPEERLLHWLEGSLDAAEASDLAEHAPSCPACAARLGSLARDLDRLQTASPIAPPEALEERAVAMRDARPLAVPARGQRWSVALAAAAGLAAVAFGVRLLVLDDGLRPEVGGDRTVQRGPDIGAPAPLEPRGAVAPATGLRFRWSNPRRETTPGVAAGEPRYRVVVVGLERVETVIEGLSTGDSWTPSAEQVARLVPGARYLWIVEPIDGDVVRPSEPVTFWLAP